MEARMGVRGALRYLLQKVLAAPFEWALAAGWGRANLGLCLGSLELAWMRQRFPHLGGRLYSYDTAPSPTERARLREVARGRRQRTRGPIRWLWIGRWVPHKGIQRLAAIVRQRLASSDDRFTIAGCGVPPFQGIEEEWLRAGRVQVVPSFSRSELPSILEGSDAGLFTSDVEGWGLSVQEMLESGMPVFATARGCVPDLAMHVVEGLGTLPLPEDLLPLAKVDLAASYWERFDWAVIAQAYEARVGAALDHVCNRSSAR